MYDMRSGHFVQHLREKSTLMLMQNDPDRNGKVANTIQAKRTTAYPFAAKLNQVQAQK